jgi:2-dehydro-3-deoxyphosphogluconate aldolase / (4S)-4-hydroxy-2-oxoglutarate aldolase
MSRHTDLLTALADARLIAVVRTPDATSAIRTAEALIEGGIRAIELTFTTPDVERAVRAVATAHPDIILGVGTITNAEQATTAADAGATFLVSPASPADLVQDMAATGRTVMAGCLTPTEILSATRAGAHAIKVFPANAVAPDYLNALHGPFPHLHLVPTGGIRPTDAHAWLQAGALAVGIGGQLSRPVHTDDDHRALVAATRAVVQPTP